MNKRELSEQEIRTRFITPALVDAGWRIEQIREEYYFTDGKVELQPNVRPKRGKRNLSIICCFTTASPSPRLKPKTINTRLVPGCSRGCAMLTRRRRLCTVPMGMVF